MIQNKAQSYVIMQRFGEEKVIGRYFRWEVKGPSFRINKKEIGPEIKIKNRFLTHTFFSERDRIYKIANFVPSILQVPLNKRFWFSFTLIVPCLFAYQKYILILFLYRKTSYYYLKSVSCISHWANLNGFTKLYFMFSSYFKCVRYGCVAIKSEMK